MDCEPCIHSSQISVFLGIIAEPNRLKILCHLKKGELCVCELVEVLDLPQNLLSHHLKSLREFGLITARREKQKIFYTLNNDYISQYSKQLNNILN